jgi:bacteriocin-like protein
MNTSGNDRELSDDELDQVTGGGPVDHKPYIGVPWGTISNTPVNNPTPPISKLDYPFPLPH